MRGLLLLLVAVPCGNGTPADCSRSRAWSRAVANVWGGGAGGAVLLAIVGFIKKSMAKK